MGQVPNSSLGGEAHAPGTLHNSSPEANHNDDVTVLLTAIFQTINPTNAMQLWLRSLEPGLSQIHPQIADL